MRSATCFLVRILSWLFSQQHRADMGADHEVLDKLDGYDPERGVKVVGHRGYFLRRWGVFLNQYGLQT